MHCDRGKKKSRSRHPCPEICGSICPSVCKKMFDFGIDFKVSGRYATRPVTNTVSSHDTESVKKSGLIVPLIVAGLVSGALLLLFFIWLMCHYGRKWNEERRDLHRVISSMESGGNVLIEERDDPVVDHPIWYIRTQGLQQSVIDSISIVKFKKGEGLVEGTDCSICLSQFEEDESLRMLPKCNHAFHVYCIDKWFESHKNCPLCRTAIVQAVVGDRAVLTAEELLEAVRLERERPNNENGVESEGHSDTNTLDGDSVPSVDGNHRSSPNNKDLFPMRGSSNAKSESDLVDGCRVMALRNEDQQQPMRRSVSADPTTAAKIYGAVAHIRVAVEESASGSTGSGKRSSLKNEQGRARSAAMMKRSASYGGKPSYAESSSSLNPVLPY